MQTKFAVLLTLMLTSCTPRLIPMPDPTPIELTSAPTPGDTTNMTPIPAFPTAPNLQSLIEKAKEDLAQRLSISTTQINVIEAKEVTWPDGSLGCPQPGMLYTQVLTPGYLIKLKHDSRDFEYHAGKAGSPTYCENPTPPFEGVPGNT